MEKTIAQKLNIKKFPVRIKDSKGNEIYREDSFGYWTKHKYDSKGNVIYFENSAGFWKKIEYDSVGNRVYYEDSHSLIVDNRNVPEYTMQDLVDKIGRFKFKL